MSKASARPVRRSGFETASPLALSWALRFPSKSVRRIAAASFGLASFLGGTAAAQSVLEAPPPTHYSLDARGVDVITGKVTLSTLDVSIGDPSAGGLAYARTYVGGSWRDSITGTVDVSSGSPIVSIGGQSEAFIGTAPSYTPVDATGSTLTVSGGVYTYTMRDGTVAVFAMNTPSHSGQARGTGITSLTTPSGDTNTYEYTTVEVPRFTGGGPPLITARRLQSVSSNSGYVLYLTYAEDNPPNFAALNQFFRVVTVTADNVATPTATAPYATYATGSVNRSGLTTNYGFSGAGLTAIRRPTSSVDDIVITYDGSGRVATWADNGNTWTYGYSTSGTTRTTTVTNPASHLETYISSTTNNRLTSYSNALSQTTSYQYDGNRRMTRATLPEGNYTDYTYDGRSNVTSTTRVAKSGSGLANIVTSATFPTTCTNPVTCNLPTATTDAMSRVTDYTYDATHGGPLTITAPAPTVGAVRPEVRFSYSSLYAWYGGVQAPSPVTRLTQISQCATTASCAGTADEVRTTIGYGSAGVASNRLPVQLSSGSGDGLLTATTNTTYTPEGDVRTVDGPLSGTADTTTYRYDFQRRLIGVIGPDPDGGGPLVHRAIRNTYNADSQITLTEQGTVTGLTDPNWAAFVSLQQVQTAYDTWGRASTVEAIGGGAIRVQQQASYDSVGRLDCSALRMNPAAFISPPASACTAATVGEFGPDRITKSGYDAANRLTSTITGFGTAQAVTQSVTYTSNGRLATLADGNSNTLQIEYDGFDRRARLRYPNPANGTPSTTDDELYGYNANSNPTSFTNRANQVFTTTFDALGRATAVAAPSPMPSSSFVYDNLGRMTQAAVPGVTTGMTWDALGRQLSESGPTGATTYGYDIAGRRTSQTWPDSFAITYDWNTVNEMTAIRRSGSAIATYTYDDRGRRTNLARSNGIGTTYAYDSVSRLNGLTHSGVANVALSYTHNPASQIVTRTMSNTAYAYNPAPGTVTNYTLNRQNRITNSGFGYDANGNLIDDGVRDYTYDAAGRLTGGGSPAGSLTYDGLGRLNVLTGTNGGRYVYSGAEASAFADPSTNVIQNHFVRGPGVDEIVASYPSASLSNPLFWMLDERNSLMGAADASGVMVFTNGYDEYGSPRSGNLGRFQYTGQLSMPDFGAYHYKARAYAPRIGRFLQTDPIGYAAGMNLYGYVGNDPINFADPSGTVAIIQICVGGGSGLGDVSHDLEEVVVTGQTCTLTLLGGGSFGGGPLSFGGGGNPLSGGQTASGEYGPFGLTKAEACQAEIAADYFRDISGLVTSAAATTAAATIYGVYSTGVATPAALGIAATGMTLTAGMSGTSGALAFGAAFLDYAATGNPVPGIIELIGTRFPSTLGDAVTSILGGLEPLLNNVSGYSACSNE